jgi:hypothetical protein
MMLLEPFRQKKPKERSILSPTLTDDDWPQKHGINLLRNYVFACTKLRHYLLYSTCIVACQTDVIKHMLHQTILSGRLGKWAYVLIEYDLVYESLKPTKGQIVADFIVEHRVVIEYDLDVSLILLTPWKLYFDGSACGDGQCIGIIFISPSGACFEMSS